MREPADIAYRRAWWSVALFPLSLVAAFVIGEGLFALLDDGVGDAPPWIVAVSAIPALVVFCLPAVPAVRCGRRAVELGRPAGRTPARIALVLAGGFVALNLVSGVVQLVAR